MVIDTGIFIEHLRAKHKAKTTLSNLSDDANIYVSSVTLYELYMGATTPQKWIDIKKLTDDIPVLSFSKEVAEKAAIIYQELKKTNKLIEFRDIFIAATAIVNNFPVLTKNAKHYTFNFYNCNIGLQGNLNELAQLLTEKGNKEEAKELENTAKALEQVEQSKSKEEVKKKGIANRLKRLAEDLENEKSTLHKTVKGIKNGISIAQDIAKGYNDIAQACLRCQSRF